jgi:spermidine synthase
VKFINETGNRYDVIYLDAYLKPSADTNSTGAPLAMRVAQFYATVRSRLNPGGMVSVNVNRHAGDGEDLRNLRDAFPQNYVFPLTGEYAVLGSTEAHRVEPAELERRGRELDQRFNAPRISFYEVARYLQR